MLKYEFVADKEKMLESEAFKQDDITRAVDDFNQTLSFGKCRGIKIEVDERWKEEESLVILHGYLLRGYTVAKLITAGIVKIRPVEGE